MPVNHPTDNRVSAHKCEITCFLALSFNTPCRDNGRFKALMLIDRYQINQHQLLDRDQRTGANPHLAMTTSAHVLSAPGMRTRLGSVLQPCCCGNDAAQLGESVMRRRCPIRPVGTETGSPALLSSWLRPDAKHSSGQTSRGSTPRSLGGLVFPLLRRHVRLELLELMSGSASSSSR